MGSSRSHHRGLKRKQRAGSGNAACSVVSFLKYKKMQVVLAVFVFLWVVLRYNERMHIMNKLEAQPD